MVKKRKLGEAFLYGFLALFSLLVSAPFLFTVIHSLMPPEQVQNAYGGSGQQNGFASALAKTVGYSAVYPSIFRYGIGMVLFLSQHSPPFGTDSPDYHSAVHHVGYGLSKFRFPGRKTLLTSYIIILLLPVQVTLVPFFIFFNTMHLMESRFPLIAFWPFLLSALFLMYQFIRSIPDDSIEAARLEGASEWRIFWRIVFPQATPGIAALTILTLIDCFSMIEQPFMLLREKSWYPMSIMLKYLSQQEYFRSFCAGRCLCHSGFPRLSAATGLPDRRDFSTAPGRVK